MEGSVQCSNWEHIFSCPSNTFYVTPYSYEAEDNWYQTKLEFEAGAFALVLSDYQRFYCIQYCLQGAARTIYYENLRNLQDKTFKSLMEVLHSRFNYYKDPYRTISLRDMRINSNESVGQFSWKVELIV